VNTNWFECAIGGKKLLLADLHFGRKIAKVLLVQGLRLPYRVKIQLLLFQNAIEENGLYTAKPDW
jgi:hypothetical protein